MEKVLLCQEVCLHHSQVWDLTASVLHVSDSSQVWQKGPPSTETTCDLLTRHTVWEWRVIDCRSVVNLSAVTKGGGTPLSNERWCSSQKVLRQFFWNNVPGENQKCFLVTIMQKQGSHTLVTACSAELNMSKTVFGTVISKPWLSSAVAAPLENQQFTPRPETHVSHPGSIRTLSPVLILFSKFLFCYYSGLQDVCCRTGVNVKTGIVIAFYFLSYNLNTCTESNMAQTKVWTLPLNIARCCLHWEQLACCNGKRRLLLYLMATTPSAACRS